MRVRVRVREWEWGERGERDSKRFRGDVPIGVPCRLETTSGFAPYL